MITQLVALVRKELIQTFRDARMRFIVLAAPVIQLVIFGYVATTEVKNIKLLLIDYDQSLVSRELGNVIFNSQYFIKVDSREVYRRKPLELLSEGKAKAIVTILRDFSKNIGRNSKAEILIQIDGIDANAANIMKVYLKQIINEYLIKKSITVGIASQSLYYAMPDISIRIWFNPELKSANYMIPGIISQILLIMTALLTALAITREKELGTIEQILVSPLPRAIFILGKTIPFVLVGFIQVLLVLGVARIIFTIPIKGNLFLLFLCSIFFLFTTLGLGLFSASVCKTQAQAMLTVFPIIMPAFLLSGFFFPINSIPAILRWIAYINPLTYFLIIVRGIFLKGSTFLDLYRELLVLIIFGVGFIIFSSLRIRKRIS
ncbi:MAG: ABC transporter permease [bacterium]